MAGNIGIPGNAPVTENLADCLDDKKTGGVGDFLFSFVDVYDFFGEESRNSAFADKKSVKAAIIKRYDALFGNVDDPDTKEFVGRHVCWKSNPAKLLQAYTSFKLKPFDEANSSSLGTKNDSIRVSGPIAGTKLGGIWKALYCLTYKIIPWAHFLFITFRIVYIFFTFIIKIIQFTGIAIINSLPTPPFPGIPLRRFPFVYKQKVGCSSYEEVIDFYPHLGDVIFKLVGTATPLFHLIPGENNSYLTKYGGGTLFFLVLIMMLISGVLIFLGGSSITVVILCFAYYCVKLVAELGNFKTGEMTAPASTQ